jgi:hypothetical protein
MKRFFTFVLLAPAIAAIVTTIMLPAAIWYAGHPFRIDALMLAMGVSLLVPYAMIGFVPAALLSVFDGYLAKKRVPVRPLVTAIVAFVAMAPFLNDAFGTAFPGHWRFLPIALHTIIPALFCSLAVREKQNAGKDA